ncbi:uncharacterized protein LOC134253055, partial [Saccostrea cucullata]|uniref:uncharacterized protein LOC134253055 n=1 Tax=Saccostrea cuccullata TaxID=36930 RepID=UPI002ED2B144
MSLSKCYTSTPETTNTARLARLLLGPCTDVLRDILKTEVKPSDLSRKVKEYIDNLQKQGKRTQLDKTQLEIFFPKPTKKYSGDYSDLDISLLYLLLRNVSNYKIAPHSKGWGKIPDPGDRSVAANIERIRLLRNQYYGHAADLSLSDSDFAQEWRNIRDIVVELERHLGTSTVYQDAVNTIKTCPMDPVQEKKYIDLLGDMKELHRTVNCISNQMQMRSFRNPTVSERIEIIKKSITTHCEDISPLFVRTRAFEKARELLGINGYVVIGGNPGTGKSTMANFLIKQLMEEGKDPLQLDKFKDLYKSLAPNDNIVVFMDNVFGEFSLSSDDVQDFTRTSETTKELFDTDTDKSNYLILTIRSDILKEYTSKGNDDTFFVSSVVDLSSKTYALQENEILQLAIKYDVCKNMEEKDFTRKVSEMSLPLGFPQCCKLAKHMDIQEDILSLAKNPVIFLRSYFYNLFENPTAKTAVLVYILLSGGEVDFDFSDNRQMDSEKKHDSLDFIGLKTSFINDFQKSINCFDGFLTIRDSIRNSLQFSHSSVQETLFNFLFYSDPKKMIQNCHHSLLQIFTTTLKPNGTKIIIEQGLFDDVICRIANVITERSVAGFRSISLLELWNDSKFHEHVLETEQCTSLLKTCQDINRDSMIVHFSRAGNRRWVEYLLLNSDERQRYRSLNVACSKNHPDVVNLILASGAECDLKTCFYAVQSGMKNSQGASVLHSVAGSGDKHAFNLLLKFELNPYEKDQESSHTILTCACQNGRLDMVKYLIGKTAHWEDIIDYYSDLLATRDNDGMTVLHSACFGGNVEIVKYLIRKGLDINAISNDGQSILHTASRNGKYEV